MRETIFPETHEWFEQKCWGKKSSPKSEKTFFYIHTNIVTKKVFLFSHEYREPKNGEKKA